TPGEPQSVVVRDPAHGELRHQSFVRTVLSNQQQRDVVDAFVFAVGARAPHSAQRGSILGCRSGDKILVAALLRLVLTAPSAHPRRLILLRKERGELKGIEIEASRVGVGNTYRA